jgi:aspartyl-tRNA(Asn)/glutamyl-tRNA(Gln) amidotransferase subunit C
MENNRRISPEEVLHVARLARIGVSMAETEIITQQLSNILENFTILQRVNTEGVPPTAQSIPLTNVMRPDETSSSLSQSDVLKNAPEHEGDFFRIRAVLED